MADHRVHTGMDGSRRVGGRVLTGGPGGSGQAGGLLLLPDTFIEAGAGETGPAGLHRRLVSQPPRSIPLPGPGQEPLFHELLLLSPKRKSPFPLLPGPSPTLAFWLLCRCCARTALRSGVGRGCPGSLELP